MLIKIALLGIVLYYAYKKLVKPMLLPNKEDNSPARYREPIKDEYLDYEEIE